MNRQHFDIPGGFPLETDTLDAMQKNSILLSTFGCLAGDKAIIQGCEDDGKSVKDGVVYVNGELLEFRGGPRQDTVVVKEDKTSKVFEDGEEHVVLCKRYLGFGTGDGALDWGAFRRFRSLIDLQQAFTPLGTIVMWGGALDTIPVGWLLCDGTKGTPDLRDRFIVGAGKTYKVADQGGADQVTLTTDQLPPHNHTANTTEAGSHSHSASTGSAGSHYHSGSTYGSGSHYHSYKDSYYIEKHPASDYGGYGYNYEYIGYGYAGSARVDTDNGYIWYRDLYTRSSGSHSHNLDTNYAGSHSHSVSISSDGKHTHSVTVDNTGGGQAHENRPPYYALAYIMYKG